MSEPTKAEIVVLEKVFDGEIRSAVSGRISPLVQLGNNKTVRACVKKGWIAEAEQTLGGRFPMKIKGYVLTERGHLAYCMTCK